MTMSHPRALIVADNPLSATAIRRVLREASMRDVIGFVDSNRPCGATVVELAPDVVIVDETLPHENVLARIAEIRAVLREAKIVVLSTAMDPVLLGQAIAAGADAAVCKRPDSLCLGALVREVAAGNVFHAFSSSPPAAPVAAPVPSRLTTRESEILRLVAAGASNGVIGRQLWITEQTVKFHLSNVYRKLGVANRTQASRYAFESGLLQLTTPQRIASRDVSVSVAA
jgi:DNA-binding NarL/FixJ family response regulator